MSIFIIMIMAIICDEALETVKRICEWVYRKLKHNRMYKVKHNIIDWN